MGTLESTSTPSGAVAFTSRGKRTDERPAVIAFTTDRGTVAYTRLERPQPEEPPVVAGSLLAGNPDLVAAVRGILTGRDPDRVHW